MSNETWILDVSPLIALARIGRLDLLTESGRRLVVPCVVAEEICRGPEGDPSRERIESGFAAPYPDVEVAVAVPAGVAPSQQ